MKKIISIVFIIIIACTFILPVYAETEQVKAKVIEIIKIEEIKEKDNIIKKMQETKIRIVEGEYENEEYEMTYIISDNIEGDISKVELKENDNILVTIEEKEGEIKNIEYIDSINHNYMFYIIITVLLILLIVIGIKLGLMPIITYLLILVTVCFLLIFSMKMGWNLILISSILSIGITLLYIIRVNGVNKKSFTIVLETIFSIAFAGILMSILFDVMGLNNINVRITNNFVNIKDLIVSCIIVVSCGLCNAIILVKLNLEVYKNKTYKTKSDNIIEGQRSLKL